MKKFIRYVMFGSIIYWIQIILTGLITEITGLWHVYSFLISLLLGWGASFFVHKHLTFQAKNLENTKFFIFRRFNELISVLVKGDVQRKENVLCRIHSECMFGDLLGSKKCDCGQQLDKAKSLIS